MSSLEDLRKEVALLTMELASLETPKFHGQKEEFPYWISKVEQVFTRHNLEEHKMFKVVVKKLRGHALEWWEKNKYKRKKRGKSKIKTWEKLRGKLEYAFAPTSYLHKHPFLPFEENCFNSSSKSPMSTCIPNSTSLFCLEEPNPNKDEKILGKEASNLVDLPPIFDDYGDDVELERQEDHSCPSPLVLDHHLNEGIAYVTHLDPYHDNPIISLSPQIEPEIAKLFTLGKQMGNTSEEQPRGQEKKREEKTMNVPRLFSWVFRFRTITMGAKEALSWVFSLKGEASTIPSFSRFNHQIRGRISFNKGSIMYIWLSSSIRFEGKFLNNKLKVLPMHFMMGTIQTNPHSTYQ